MKELKFRVAELPPGINQIRKLEHNHMYGRERDRWAFLIRQAIGPNNPLFQGRVKIHYRLYRVGGQIMDKDNAAASFKLVGDALKNMHIIIDDNSQIVDEDLSVYQQVRVPHKDQQGIEVTITSLDDVVRSPNGVTCGVCSRNIDPSKMPYWKASRSGRVMCSPCYNELKADMKHRGMGKPNYELVVPAKGASL